MNKAQQFEALIAIKKRRVRRAESDLQIALKRAENDRIRLADVRETLSDREAKAATYAMRRFQAVQGTVLQETFFTTLALGMYRKRRDLASQRLQMMRIESNSNQSAMEASRFAADLVRLRQSLDAVTSISEAEARAAQKQQELKDEEELISLVSMGK